MVDFYGILLNVLVWWFLMKVYKYVWLKMLLILELENLGERIFLKCLGFIKFFGLKYFFVI